jgi:hypothetical protein
MLRFLEHRIADQRIIRLIRKWLEAGVIEDGRRIPAQRGTPQGAGGDGLNAKDNFEFERSVRYRQERKKYDKALD